MAHFTRTQTDATWTNDGAEGYVLPRADLESLDAKQFKSINGDRGGTWRPSSPIVLTSSGLALGTKVRITGLTKVDYGGKLTIANGKLRLPAGKFPTFAEGHALRERDILTPCLFARRSNGYHWARNLVASTTRAGLTSIACTIQEQYWSGATGDDVGTVKGITQTRLIQPKFAVPLHVHDGARLTTACLCWRVSSAVRDVPAAMPKLRVVRVSKTGVVEPLASAATGADADGWISVPQVASYDAWYQGNEPHRLTYTCDQSNVIDRGAYTYYLEVVEEQAVKTPLADGVVHYGVVRKEPTVCAVATSNVNLGAALPTIDGVTVPDFGMFLLTAQTDPTQNGIRVNTWTLAGAYGWSPTLPSPDRLTGYTLISIAKGTVYQGSIWQITRGNGGTFAAVRLSVPIGNEYHSVVCHFDSIADMRPA